jgi:serine/threonine protein kinase
MSENKPQQKLISCPECGLALDSTEVSCPKDGTLLSAFLSNGTIFASKYELLGVIGAGGMGVIYKARQIGLDKIVAVKMMHSHLASEALLSRFHLEAKAIGALSNPHIVAIHDFDITTDGQPYIVMDYIDGETLAENLARRGQLPFEKFHSVFEQICEALSNAHRKGILHRDLKPSNIMLAKTPDEHADVRLMDFGLAKVVSDLETPPQALTRTGETLGSPLYMSPEQARGEKTDARSDLYSLGCIMYEALSGSPPFHGRSSIETMLMHQKQAPLPLKEASLGAVSDQYIETIVLKLLEKDPANRFQSVDDLLASLANSQKDSRIPVSHRNSSITKIGAGPASLAAWKPVLFIVAVAVCGVLSTTIFRSLFLPKHQTQQPSAHDSAAQAPVTTGNTSIKDKLNQAYLVAQIDYCTQYRNLSLDLRSSQAKGQKATITKASLAKISENAQFLKKLYMEDLGVTNEGLGSLSTLTELEELSLSRNHAISNLTALCPLQKKLLKLRLADTNIDCSAMGFLAGCSALETLDLRGTRIVDADLENLTTLHQLENLDIANCKISADAVKRFRLSMPKCRVLTQPGERSTADLVDQAEAIMKDVKGDDARKLSRWDDARKLWREALSYDDYISSHLKLSDYYAKYAECLCQSKHYSEVEEACRNALNYLEEIHGEQGEDHAKKIAVLTCSASALEAQLKFAQAAIKRRLVVAELGQPPTSQDSLEDWIYNSIDNMSRAAADDGQAKLSQQSERDMKWIVGVYFQHPQAVRSSTHPEVQRWVGNALRGLKQFGDAETVVESGLQNRNRTESDTLQFMDCMAKIKKRQTGNNPQ